jgi:hypothetical protein
LEFSLLNKAGLKEKLFGHQINLIILFKNGKLFVSLTEALNTEIPGTGRFISHDTWSGDANMLMSYNAWLYGYRNPVRYVDESGLSPYQNGEIYSEIQTDLTTWMPLELVDWVNDPIVMKYRDDLENVRQLLEGSAESDCTASDEWLTNYYANRYVYQALLFMQKYHGDNPQVYEAVTMGEELWQKFGDNMTRKDFIQVMHNYLYKLQSPPTHGYKKQEPKWQENHYSPGRFDYFGGK